MFTRVFFGLSLFFLAAKAADDLICAHNRNGSCNAGNFLGYCHINVSNGHFDCDEDFVCASKRDSMRQKERRGCFNVRGTQHCCCGAPDFCNYHIVKTHNLTGNQVCVAQSVTDAGATAPTDCRDFWCVGISFDSGDDSGLFRMCHTAMAQTELDTPQSKQAQVTSVLGKMRCGELWDKFGGTEEETAVQAVCINISGEVEGKMTKGKYCCCRGSEKCNSQEQMSLIRGPDEADIENLV